MVRARPRLDSELFPESMAIRNFRDTRDYTHLLCARHVDVIVHYDTYDAARHTNEHAMLEQLHLPIVTSGLGYQVYAFDRARCD